MGIYKRGIDKLVLYDTVQERGQYIKNGYIQKRNGETGSLGY